MTTRPIWSRSAGLLACGAALSALLAAGAAAAEEPTIDQIEYHPAELPPDGARTRLILTGVGLTVGWYGAGVGVSYLWPDAPNASDLRLPVVGPWLALGDVGCGSDEASCSTGIVIARTALAVVSGVGQAGGLIAIVEGLLMDTASSKAAPAKAERGALGPTFSAAPVVLSGGAGVEFFGRF
jgi:hypothetical protein